MVLRAGLFLCMMTDYRGEGSARASNRSTKGVPPSRFGFEEQGKTPVVVTGDGGSGRSSVSSRSTYATRRTVLLAEKRAADAELELAKLEEEELCSRGSKSLSGGGAERSSSPKMMREVHQEADAMQTVDEEEDGESVSSSSSSLSRAHAKGQTPSDSVVQHRADESGEVRHTRTHSAPEQTVIHVHVVEQVSVAEMCNQ